jgi:hypothetical protein
LLPLPDSIFEEEGLQIRRRPTGENEGVSHTSVPAIRTYRLFSRPKTYFRVLVGWRTEFTN